MTIDSENLDTFKPTHPEFRYQDYPFYWIARVASIYSQRMERELKREGLNVTGWRVGMILRQHGSLSISEISTHAAIRLSTVTRCVYLMQERGWLSVRRSPTDARVTEARVTAAGQELIERMIARTSRVFNRAFRGVSAQELVEANDLLQRINHNLLDDY